ncbi:alpha/beta fold hydrolase [Desulforegula conservatrix]|uniref:alpha/beta fold hydrolase n=1 Tax=Desulforegula conservatrix TaxID=153026 RepID=UPI00041F3D26|nr:alpha/beta fold hydrolase [Desulforegula conservatrix]
MNRFAFLTSTYALKKMYDFSKAKIIISDSDKIPSGPNIFVINHFTRIETLFLPFHLNKITSKPVWALADSSLFTGPLEGFLRQAGAVSTKSPDRDLLIIKSLLIDEADWIIFPEGKMVKDKKVFHEGEYVVSSEHGPGLGKPHTGAANLALRTEFYRQRIKKLSSLNNNEALSIIKKFNIDSFDRISDKSVNIIPVNITYYPIRAKENAFNLISEKLMDGITERVREEIMTEGTMLLSGVDIDIRFGDPINIAIFMNHPHIQKDINSNTSFEFDDIIPSLEVLKKAAEDIMTRYMSDIYNMTTLNHDHLFSSLLKMIPAESIEAVDLKNRVYLAATLDIDKENLHIHSSLQENQIHLLTDDRYGKFSDFIKLAQEKGIIKIDNGIIKKDNSAFLSKPAFHQIRFENPVSVMANEVEPIDSIRPHLYRLALDTKFNIKRRIAFHLLSKGIESFDLDYEKFYISGESKNKDVGRPFLLEGDKRDTGILIIHGYMAAPLEVRALSEYLNKEGYWVYAPRLKGHGTSPLDLSTRKYLDWIESVEEGYAILKNFCSNVIVGGFSTGAGLALYLAAKIPDVTGVFAISPPLRLQDFMAKFMPALGAWNRIMGSAGFEGRKKNYFQNNPENPHINYLRNPALGILELEKLMDEVKDILPDVLIPTFIIQGHRDPVVNSKGSLNAYELIGSEDKEFSMYNFNRHGIINGEGSEIVFEALARFIKRTEKKATVSK